MWLINVHSYALEEFLGEGETPPYAILSHMWSRPASAEVTFREMREDLASAQSKPCFMKIFNSCVIAKSHHLSWILPDSAECLVYLDDVSYYQTGVPRSKRLEAIGHSRWFSRGWTLQELIAPKKRYLYDGKWNAIPGGVDLLQTLANAGNLPVEILEDRDQLPNISLANRMAMASKRTTTRGEDMAYCLFGIFDVNLPILYGEGAKRAFRRLQLEILATNAFDHSIFAWRADRSDSGLLANSPADFADTPSIGNWLKREIDPILVPFSMTNLGLSFNCNIVVIPKEEGITPSRPNEDIWHALAPLQCHLVDDESSSLCLYLEFVPESHFRVNDEWLPAYRRVKCSEWALVPHKTFTNPRFVTISVLEDEQYRLFI